MSHMYIMAYDDMFQSDSFIFRFLRAMYHATQLPFILVFFKKLLHRTL